MERRQAEEIARQALATVEAQRAAEQARTTAEVLAQNADEMEARAVDDLWAYRHGERSLLAEIREVTCGRMIRPTGCTHAEWRERVPSHYLRTSGIGADDVAEQMGMSEDELLAAVEHEVATRPSRKADLATEAAGEVSAVLAAAEEAAAVAEAEAQVAAEVLAALAGERLARVAVAAAKVGGDVEQVRLIVLATQGMTLVETGAKVATKCATQGFVPRRESRRADLVAAVRDRVAEVRREVRDGLAAAAGMVWEFWTEWAADAGRDADARARAARGWMGGTGRHGRRAAWA